MKIRKWVIKGQEKARHFFEPLAGFAYLSFNKNGAWGENGRQIRPFTTRKFFLPSSGRGAGACESRV
jgi:hypothetical protein